MFTRYRNAQLKIYMYQIINNTYFLLHLVFAEAPINISLLFYGLSSISGNSSLSGKSRYRNPNSLPTRRKTSTGYFPAKDKHTSPPRRPNDGLMCWAELQPFRTLLSWSMGAQISC